MEISMTDAFNDRWARYVAALAKANQLNMAAIFDALQTAGLTTVCITFDGEGDSGQIESVTAYSGDCETDLPATVVKMHEASWDSDATSVREMPLREPLLR
jgi:hypothetical protein